MNFFALVAALLLVFSAQLQADRILVISDSWSPGIARGLGLVLKENGFPDITVEGLQGWGAAAGLSSSSGLRYITGLLNDRPDTIIVHLQTGAHDWLASGWVPAWSDQQENNLIAGVIRNVEIVVDHILSLRPNIQVLWSTYDYIRPIERGGTPAENNRFLIKMAEQKEQLALTKLGLSFVDVYGTLQVTFGFDGIQHTEFDPDYVIPPGDPSLPNPDFPSPIKTFKTEDPLHLNLIGHTAVAQAQYDRYYANQLGAKVIQINAGLNDAWFYPETSGQGFFITVFPVLGYVSLAWFTYDTELPAPDAIAYLGDAGHRWLTALGPIVGNKVIMDIDITSGGIFDTATVVQHTDPAGSDGTITLVFHDCNSGTITYNIPSPRLQGNIPITRVANDNIALCEALTAQ